MKKLFLGIIGLLFASSTAYGLSCASFPSFEDQLGDAMIVVEGTIEDVQYVSNGFDEEFCAQQGGNATPGTYTYTISVDRVLKGTTSDTLILTREVSDINCTRGGACADMEVGGSYTILSNDGETLSGGLCSSCPYQEIVDEQPETDMCICTMEYDPQCGVDGQTYSNRCVAGCDNVEIAYAGECEFGDPNKCDRGYSGPVCGTNGVSYEDTCDMEAVGVSRAYDGFCVENPNPLNIVDAPNFCTSRYDGCNNCTITNSALGACTKKACFQQERAKCVAFDFMYLTSSHEQLIESVIDTWLESTSPDDKARVITKVAEKIADINYTLSVSSFMQGSPALRNFQFTLEILWKIDGEL